MTPNQKQIEAWNGEAGQRWARQQRTLEELFRPFIGRVLDGARLYFGDDVLDVGCGAGALAVAASRRVGPRGLVLGVDVSRVLLAQARDRTANDGALRIRFVEADAQCSGFGGPRFDAVISRFGVMFFDDPRAAFENLRGALRPGGRLCFACWQPATENPWITIGVAAAKGIVDIAPQDPNAPGPFAFGDRERVRGILDQAGFSAIAIEPLGVPLRFGGSAAEAASLLAFAGPVAWALADAPEATRARVRDAIVKLLEPFTTPSGIVVPSLAWLVTARNPGR